MQRPSQETCLEFIHRPLRMREKGFVVFIFLAIGRGLGGIAVMRLNLFVLISVAAHALALSYPFDSSDRGVEVLRPVAVLHLADESGAEVPGSRRAKANKPLASSARITVPPAGHGLSEKPKEILIAHAPANAVAELVRQAPDTTVTFPANQPTAIMENISENPAASDLEKSSSNSVVASPGSNGLGPPQAERSVVTRFVQVRYAYSPKPEYPDGARREGKEGRVLLRVLVDAEGRSKSIQVTGSSGNEALDQSAAEAIKRWRFSPARYGDEPVASWVRIPIDFRLTEPNK